MKPRYPVPKQAWETFGAQRQKSQNQVRAIQSAMTNRYKISPKSSRAPKSNSLIKPLPKLKKIKVRRKSSATKVKKIKPIRSPK
jgi:hypothetical protein